MFNLNPATATPLDEIRRSRVRTFVRRHGRITPAQQRALQLLWPKYGVRVNDCGVRLNLDTLFNRSAATTLEIGFGDGASLVQMGLDEPHDNFLGIDVYPPGIGKLLLALEKHQLENVKVIEGDAQELLDRHFEDSSLDRVLIFFPDPWPKKRHQKRRLVQTEFVELVADKLKPQGLLQIATDWQDYAEHIGAVLDQSSHFIHSLLTSNGRAPTKYERRGRRLGHEVWDFYYQKN